MHGEPVRYMDIARSGVVLLVAVVILGAVADTAAGTARNGQLGDVATVDATPTDPNEAESTHAVVVPLESGAESPGSTFNDVVVDYAVGTPEADVSNVGAGTVERIGIDRGGDNRGTRVDAQANITTVSGKRDGGAVRIATAGDLTLQRGDEVVVVMRPVQNPQNAGTAEVELTINSQNANDTATGTVTYEYNGANVTFDDPSTTGETVTVSSVRLSEGGFVAVQNSSGTGPDTIRGHSGYLPAGTHEDVTVQLDVPLESDDELFAQAYTDANADRRFEYGDAGEEDFPYRNRDGNLMGTDSAQVTYTEETATPTPTPTPDGGDETATPTPTLTPDGGDETPTPTETYAWDDDGQLKVDTPTETEPSGSDTPTATDSTDDETASPTDSTDDGTASPTDEEAPGGTTAGDGQPGFGLAAALVALAGAVLLARRRD